MLNRSLRCFAALSLATVIAGCSGDGSSEDPETTEGELAAASDLAPARIAFETPEGLAMVGSKQKITKVMKAFKQPSGEESLPHCAPGGATNMTFFDKAGAELARGAFFCFRGNITKRGASEPTQFYFRPGELDLLDGPAVPADALWGITKIDIETKRLQEGDFKAEIRDASAIEKILTAFDPEQTPRALGPVPRCMPDRFVKFWRGDRDVADAEYVCGLQPGDPVIATLRFVPIGGRLIPAAGNVKIDAAVIDAVFAQARRETTR